MIRSACFFALIAAAQTPLRVSTHLVEVSVVVQTRQGQPVSGLTAADFELLDEGQPQKIAFANSQTALASAGLKPHRLPPDFYTNRREEGAPENATAILFDGLNTRLPDQIYAKDQILKFIERLQPGERIALYLMGRGPRILQDFTSDTAALRQALLAQRTPPAASLEAPLYDPELGAATQFDSWLGELTFGLYEFYGKDRAFRTVRALTAIAAHLQQYPGRKNLIWVAGSFPVSLEGGSVPLPRRIKAGQRDAGPEVEQAARALSRAQVAIYPVDARGLIATQEYAGQLTKPELRNPDTSESVRARALAERTGGRAFSTNDLAGAMRRAADDARLSYVLGYYPAHGDWKGKFRKIEVRVRRPDVELHYRHGYFAQPDELADPWYREQTLDAAVWSPLDATALGLTVAVKGNLTLELQVDAGNVAFRKEEGKWIADLDVWLVQLDAKEQRLATQAHTNSLKLEQATYDQVMRARGLLLLEQLAVAPRAALLRVLVRDTASGALGTLTVPLARYRDFK